MSSANPINPEDGRRDDSDQKRDDAAPTNSEQTSQNLMADKPIEDADFIPKFSAVRSKHDDEQENWSHGSSAQETFEAPKPEAEPPFNIEMQEFGFHKDVIEPPSLLQNAVSANVPSAHEQYQAHLNQIQSPAQSLNSEEGKPNPSSSVSGSAPNDVTPQANAALQSKGNSTPIVQDHSALPIDDLPDDATELFESESEKQQRVKAIRDSLYWIVEEAQLVRHGDFDDYDPDSDAGDENGNANASETFDSNSPEYAPTVRVQDATASGAVSKPAVPEQQLPPPRVEAVEKPSLALPPEPANLASKPLASPVSSQRSDQVSEQRTTYDGKKNAIEPPAKTEQIKKALISVGSVILLCIASVVITYDTIVAKKPPELKPETESTPVASEKTGTKKDEPTKETSKPSSVKEELKKAFALEQKKNYIEALEHFDKVLEDEANKTNTKALHGRGRVLTKLQRYDRALEDLELASDLDKGNELILIDLAAVKYLLADYPGAAREYERILSAHEGDVDALYGRGISYAAMGKNDEAIADFENVVKLKPGYDKAYRQMCTTFLAINQPDKAEAAITVAMKACGTDADLFFSRGLARYQMGRKEEAIEDYDEAIRENPKRKEYYNDRGYVLMELGRTDDAKKDFRQALEIDPHYKLAVDNLARIDKLRKKHEKD